MQRRSKQKLDGDGWDWTSKHTRRLFRLAERPGVGKATKKRMARRRWRLSIDPD